MKLKSLFVISAVPRNSSGLGFFFSGSNFWSKLRIQLDSIYAKRYYIFKMPKTQEQ